MEGADQVLPMARVDPRLAADGGIHLGEQRGRNLDEAHAAPNTRRREAGEIADDAAAERHDEIAALQPCREDRVANRLEHRIGFRCLAGLHRDRRMADLCRVEARAQGVEVMAGDIVVGDDRAGRSRRDPGDRVAGPRQQSGADQDVVAAPWKIDAHAPRGGEGRR